MPKITHRDESSVDGCIIMERILANRIDEDGHGTDGGADAEYAESEKSSAGNNRKGWPFRIREHGKAAGAGHTGY